MRSAATELSPAWSNSLASGGKSAAVAKTASALASVAALMVKQPVPPSSGGRQFAKVSLSVPSGRWAGPIITVKGVLVTALKQENGARFSCPLWETVPTTAMGRGTTVLIISP